MQGPLSTWKSFWTLRVGWPSFTLCGHLPPSGTLHSTPRTANCFSNPHSLKRGSSPFCPSQSWTLRVAGHQQQKSSWAGRARGWHLYGQTACSKSLPRATHEDLQKPHLHLRPSPHPSSSRSSQGRRREDRDADTCLVPSPHSTAILGQRLQTEAPLWGLPAQRTFTKQGKATHHLLLTHAPTKGSHERDQLQQEEA